MWAAGENAAAGAGVASMGMLQFQQKASRNGTAVFADMIAAF